MAVNWDIVEVVTMDAAAVALKDQYSAFSMGNEMGWRKDTLGALQ
jgi:hypothetical protein